MILSSRDFPSSSGDVKIASMMAADDDKVMRVG
jgi:hypothetical protein